MTRKVFSGQLKEMFRLGKLPVNDPEVTASKLKPLYLDGLASFDEKHLKQKIGVHCKRERRVREYNCSIIVV